MIYDIIIIGAGASGLMLASKLQKSKKIAIVDSNSKIGEKIKISGGAKCNITNKYMNENHFLGDKEFIKDTLDNFSEKELLKFLNKNNVYPKIDEKIVKGTYFCNSSSDVINIFLKLTKHCHFKLDTKVQDINFDKINNYFEISTNKQTFKTYKVVVASGGLAYPILGASNIGFEIAKKFNHNIVKPTPALVG
ncbi:MAG: NAD(P)/FAD-dependent oxidoreductase, partial [Campylobacterota bacterium]|nr:NAD(P)/FAD-dependent oxidoreductase [Campylobacterota bacterium]